MALDLSFVSTVNPSIVTPPAGGTDVGPIAILADRSTLQCNPDSVRFSVDLSSAGFTVPGPGAGEIYDRCMHELIYLWDFGDSVSWLKPQKVLTEWRNGRTATGAWVAHCYANAGNYPVNLMVVDPIRNEYAVAPVIDVSVADQGTVYAGAQTICVNPVGDTDFTGAPLSAQQVNLDLLDTNAPVWASNQDATTPLRWLFKRGTQCDVSLFIDEGHNPHQLFGAYGAGPAPTIIPPSDGIRRAFEVEPRYQQLNGTVRPDFRMQGLKFQGGFDPTSETPSTTATPRASNVIRTDKYLDMVVDDCEVRGMVKSSFAIYMGTNSDITKQGNFHLNDSLVTDFGGQYPLFFGPILNDGSSVTITGSSVTQNPSAADTRDEIRATMRVNNTKFTHVRGSDFFSLERSNSGVKLTNSPRADGMVVTVQQCSIEGGLFPLDIAGNTGASSNGQVGRSTVHNIICERMRVTGYYSSQTLVSTQASGVTLRDLLCHLPAGPRDGVAFQNGFRVELRGAPAANVLDAPINFYNNTLIMARDIADNNNNTPGAYDIDPAFTDVNLDNVLLDGNWSDSFTDLGPLDQSTMWTAFTEFSTDPITFVSDPAFAIGDVATYAPLSGTDVVSGLSSYHDITGAVRPSPADVGAWEQT